jgi:LacI family transcriptional regulator
MILIYVNDNKRLMKTNIKTVAKKAGVSVATVSRVINNYKGVKNTTKEKVTKAMEDLDYEVNAVARSLKLRKTLNIGIIVANILSPFFSEIAKAVEEEANNNNYNVILCNSDDNAEKELKQLKILKSNRVAGIILTPTQKNKDYIKGLLRSDMKLVIIDRLIKGISCNSVVIDNEVGSYNATCHLLNKGYKKIAIINGPLEVYTAKNRLNGYIRALKEANIHIDEDLIKIGTFKEKSGFELTKSLIESTKRPDSIFVTNMDLALGALIALQEKKLKVPKDIALICFSDCDWTKVTNPPLTTISFKTKNIGIIATKVLINMINKKTNNINHTKIFKVKTKLLVRGST